MIYFGTVSTKWNQTVNLTPIPKTKITSIKIEWKVFIKLKYNLQGLPRDYVPEIKYNCLKDSILYFYNKE